MSQAIDARFFCVATILASGALMLLAPPVEASFTNHASFTGRVGLSTDGLGTVNDGILRAEVPLNSTIVGAYLYAQKNSTNTWGGGPDLPDLTFAGNPLGVPTLLDGGNSALFDITGIVQAAYNPGAVAQIFAVIEQNADDIEGTGLAVVYRNPILGNGFVDLYAGGQSGGLGRGDALNFTANLPASIDNTRPVAMHVGIDFSVDASTSQRSEIDVNGARLTSSAGGNDDGVRSNGELLTMGGTGDSLANPPPLVTNTDNDDELYTLNSFVNSGDVSINFDIRTSTNDRMFFIGLQNNRVVPEPSGIVLAVVGVLVTSRSRWRRRPA